MTRPLTIPEPSRFAERPHGTRLRYVSGCRCVPCRAANSRYESSRLRRRARGEWNGYVSAAAARDHLLALSAKGMGYKRVAALAKVSCSVVAKVRFRTRLQIRAVTERRILAVTFVPSRATLVSAGPTWTLLNKLIAEGYPAVRLARWLGMPKSTGLQIGRRRVTHRTAVKVRALYRRLTAEARVA